VTIATFIQWRKCCGRRPHFPVIIIIVVVVVVVEVEVGHGAVVTTSVTLLVVIPLSTSADLQTILCYVIFSVFFSMAFDRCSINDYLLTYLFVADLSQHLGQSVARMPSVPISRSPANI